MKRLGLADAVYGIKYKDSQCEIWRAEMCSAAYPQRWG